MPIPEQQAKDPRVLACVVYVLVALEFGAAPEVVGFVQQLREMDLFKQPGVAETIDWAHALTQLDCMSLDPEMVNDTLGTLLKYQDDIQKIQGSEAALILEEVKRDMAVSIS